MEGAKGFFLDYVKIPIMGYKVRWSIDNRTKTRRQDRSSKTWAWGTRTRDWSSAGEVVMLVEGRNLVVVISILDFLCQWLLITVAVTLSIASMLLTGKRSEVHELEGLVNRGRSDTRGASEGENNGN